MEPGITSALGPNLLRIHGRRIASDPSFTFSPALEALSGRWSEESLDQFLTDPQAFAPGTFMVSEPMTDPEERTALIDYLKTLR